MKNKIILFIYFLLHITGELYAQAPRIANPGNAVPESDVYLVQAIFRNGSIAFGGVKNITERPGYDNQPSFDINGNLLYVSIREDKQAEIYKYDMEKKFISKFTVSKTSEYSPRQCPDGKFISHVTVEKDSTQRIWKTDIATGLFQKILTEKSDSIGYYTWLNDSTIAFAKITKPMSLWSTNIKSGKETFLASDIGRSMSVSGEGLLYYTHMIENKRWLMRVEEDGKHQPLIEFQDGASEDFCFAPGNIILNAKNGMLYFTDHDFSKGWKATADWERAGIKNIQRLALSPDGKWLALVVMK